MTSRDYVVDQQRVEGEPQSLCAEYTHLLLVDDGYGWADAYSNAYVQFRVALQAMLAAPAHAGGLGVPTVVVLYRGGLGSLWQTVQSACAGVPCLCLAGSGRAADILSSAAEQYSELRQHYGTGTSVPTEAAEPLKSQLRRDCESLIEDPTDEWRPSETIEQIVDRVLIALAADKLRSFALHDGDELDEALIRLLADEHGLDLLSVLELTMKWNRVDLAESLVISNPKSSLTKEQLFAALHTALACNLPAFVHTFTQHGFAMDEFLTYDRLQQLYRSELHPEHHLCTVFKLKKTKSKYQQVNVAEAFELSMVNKLCKKLAGRQGQWLSQPFMELMLWAMLTNRRELVMLFWQNVQEPLTMALVGTLLCYSLRKKLQSDDSALAAVEAIGLMKELVRLETAAVKLINYAYERDQVKATYVIHRPSHVWGNMDAVQLAEMAKDRAFIATPCVQQAIFRRWKADLDVDAWEILTCNFLVFPIMSLNIPATKEGLYSKFGEGQAKKNLTVNIKQYLPPQKTDEWKPVKPRPKDSFVSSAAFKIPKGGEVPPACKQRAKHLKLRQFYMAPAVKFTNHMIAYLVYLALYSYMVVFDFNEHNVSTAELLVYVWQLAMLLDTVRALHDCPSATLRAKVLNSFIRLIDIIALTLSVAAFICRFWIAGAFPVARLLNAVAVAPYYMSAMKLHMANSYLGPKVMIIKRMIKDLARFMTVMAIFFASYTIASMSLVHAGGPFSVDVLWQIYHRGVWDVFGRVNPLATDGVVPGCEVEESSELGNGTTTSISASLDCRLRSLPIPLFLTAYLLFGNILLINMLIAVFTHVFDKAQREAEYIWKYQMLYLLREFNEHKPMLPGPLMLISLTRRFARAVFDCCYYKLCCRKRKSKTALKIFGCKMSEQDLGYLRIFEQWCRGEYLQCDADSQ